MNSEERERGCSKIKFGRKQCQLVLQLVMSNLCADNCTMHVAYRPTSKTFLIFYFETWSPYLT
jgi:hypothetical protein